MIFSKKWLKFLKILGYIIAFGSYVIEAVEPLFPSVKSTRNKLDEFVDKI